MVDEKKKQTIFIVEDDVDLCEMLTAYFRVQGYDVKNANRGEDAVTAIQEVLPDLAVLDIRLPDIDGFEVCAAIKKTARLKIKVILYTAYIDAVNAAKARTSGADEYCAKITDVATFSEIVETFIN